MGPISRYANRDLSMLEEQLLQLTLFHAGQTQESGKDEDREPTPENFTMMQGVQSEPCCKRHQSPIGDVNCTGDHLLIDFLGRVRMVRSR
jgi:hypothetical protein